MKFFSKNVAEFCKICKIFEKLQTLQKRCEILQFESPNFALFYSFYKFFIVIHDNLATL